MHLHCLQLSYITNSEINKNRFIILTLLKKKLYGFLNKIGDRVEQKNKIILRLHQCDVKKLTSHSGSNGQGE